MKRALAFALILPALALSLAGCSLRQTVARTSSVMLEDMIAALGAEPDPAHAREAAASLLVMIEGFARADPDGTDLRRIAAQAYGGFAFGFLEKSEPTRARRFYKRGRDHGLSALGQEPGFSQALKAGPAALKSALGKISRENLPLLFWTAYSWSGWINMSRGNPDAVADLPIAAAMMARALALDPSYFHGGPHLFFGVYYGGRSPLMGGDPKKAKAHFERAVALSKGRFLTAKLLYARYLAVQTQDRKLFLRLLDEIEKAPSGLLPDQALSNALARRRAKELRKQIDELF